MANKKKSASPFSAIKKKIKKSFVAILRAILNIKDSRNAKKNKKKEESQYTDPLSLGAGNSRLDDGENEYVWQTRRPSSINDFKENKQYKRKHREVKYKRELKEQKELKKKKAAKVTVGAVSGLLALAVLVAGAFSFYSSMRHNDIEDTAKRFIEGTGKGKGYPYEINSSDVIDMQAIGSNLAVLTQDNFLILNSTAKEVVRYLHGYSQPSMCVYGSRAMIYDKATGKFCILNSSEVLAQGDIKAEIYSAVMSKDGSTAFSVKTESAASELVVLSPSLEKKYTLATVNEKIFDCAIAPNSKGAAILLVGSKNAQIYSKILIVDFKSEKPVSEFKYDDTILFDILYPSRNKVIAVGTNIKTVISKKNERSDDYKYLDSPAIFYDKASSGRNLLVLDSHGTSSQKVVEFDSKSKLKFEINYNQKIHAVSCSNNYAAVLFDNKAILLNNSGKVHKEFKTNKNGKKIVNIGNDVYILYSSNIAKNS